MLQSKEEDILGLIKIDFDHRYIELSFTPKEWYVRVVNDVEIQKVFLKTDAERMIGIDVINKLKMMKTKELEQSYPLAMVYDNNVGFDGSIHVDSRAMIGITGDIDSRLLMLKVMTIKELSGLR